MLDQLSTTIRPKRKYKTDRKDLDGGGMLRGQGLIDSLLTSGVQGSPWQVDIKKGMKLLSDPELFAPGNKMPVADAKKLVQYDKDSYKEAKKKAIIKPSESY